MKPYLFKSEIMVFEENGWGIIVDTSDEHAENIYATHEECSMTEPEYDKRKATEDVHIYGEYCWTMNTPPVCSQCNDEVPEEIQGLMVLHSWDEEK